VPTVPDFRAAGFGAEKDNYMDEHKYITTVPKLFEAVRKACGEEVELLHDVHERSQPMDVINMCRRIEEYRPFLLRTLSHQKIHAGGNNCVRAQPSPSQWENCLIMSMNY